MSHTYNDKFMAYADESSRRSAARVTQQMATVLHLASVLDVGCAKGTWLQAWRAAGIDDIQGVDGDYVDRSQLVIPTERFLSSDLSRQVDLGRTFDLVQSLEVAEHIPATSADTFVENLTRHSRGLILFSAAPPGQGGEFHINEQPYDYWRQRFAARGFAAYDYLRPLLAGDPSISYWYRYNMFLYAHESIVATLPAAIRDSRVSADRRLRDVSPLLFRVRKSVVSLLPAGTRDALARFKANFFPSGRW